MLTFQLPLEVSSAVAEQLQRSMVIGGQDYMPFCTRVVCELGRLVVQRHTDESGYLVAPWPVDGIGQVMTTSATVIERPEPYQLQVELARGLLNQVRMQTWYWQMDGLEVPAALTEIIGTATRRFGRAITYMSTGEFESNARAALQSSHEAAQQLMQAYVQQVLCLRHERQSQLDTTMSCRLFAPIPSAESAQEFLSAFNTVTIPFPWHQVEPSESNYTWESKDAILEWSFAQKLAVIGGPLIDFSAAQLPAWLAPSKPDVATIAARMGSYVTATLKRYRGRIRTWQLTASSNAADVLALGEDELLWLTVRMVEAARSADPEASLMVGVAQPWGELMALRERRRSPFEFADTLGRAGLNIAGLDLELIMGVSPRGSYCRELLDVSRIIDLYSLLGMPLSITLGYPSATTADPKADPTLTADAGYWRNPPSPDSQAAWAERFSELILAKPAVRCTQWCHWDDREGHTFPNCGLVGTNGQIKPAVSRLRELRSQHLR